MAILILVCFFLERFYFQSTYALIRMQHVYLVWIF